jgi:16S rRNA (guanine(1405)-N(7))-methyltransferase
MMPANSDTLDELVRQVCESQKYAVIDPTLVRRLGAVELQKRGSLKEAVKSTRNKLHQIGSAYQEKPIPYAIWQAELAALPADLAAESVQAFLRRCMQAHASTQERLNIHETFFRETLSTLGPIHSVLDLACGLNPLNLPWMPLAADVSYSACDIYTDMIDFLNRFFTHFQVQGSAFACDLTQTVPAQPVQLVLLLKTIPCLEQVDKQAGLRLLEGLQAENILVTFPAHSLGGRSKGMVQNYSDHFGQLVAGKPWQITRFDYPGELAFLIRK